MNETRATRAVNTAARFGTIGGVFTPCTLTILGVIMFLRFGQVVGNAGIWRALLIVLLAKTITTITAMSLSAIATNTRVKGGGAYFLISRSLGVEFGGAIGLVFFLSQAISVAMYVVGFTEALLATWPGLGDPRYIGTIVNLLVCLCVYIGAGWTIKVQYVILAILLAAVGVFAAGALGNFSTTTFASNWNADYIEHASFFTMFALFFPAATGIMAGANMSGDLADPQRSIPRGTLAAILVTGIIYAALALLLGGAGQRADLHANTMIVAELSAWAPAITAGIFAATLSSALGSMMGAPRILQALARDKVFPVLNPFAAGSGSTGEPRRAIIVSAIIAQFGILLGDLNAIAPIITMFFMITYGALNLATFAEAYSRNPSWRPTFRCPWPIALIGAAACIGAMFLIDPLWALIAIVAMLMLHRYLLRQDLEAAWGDVNSGTTFERARRNLLVLEQERYHPKNWRPAVLALGAAKDDRLRLANFSRWLAGRHGLLFFGQVIVGATDDLLDRQARHQKLIRKFSDEHELAAFPAVVIADDLGEGVGSLVQCCGIGAMRPNLVLLGWSTNVDTRDIYCACIRRAHRLGRSVGILRLQEQHEPPAAADEIPRGPIDVWWLGQSNGELMVLLAHLLRQNPGWRDRRIRLRRMIANEAGQDEARRHLEQLVSAARIDAVCDVVIGTDFASVVAARSRRAALTILGFRAPDKNSDANDFVAALDRISTELPRVLLVNSAGDMQLQVDGD